MKIPTTGEIDVKYDVLEVNRELAQGNRHRFDERDVTAFNIMGAIGKTLLITSLVSTSVLWL